MSSKLPKPLFQPTQDRLLVLRDEDPERSAGGIIVPEQYRDQRAAGEGVVLAVGPGRRSEKTGERLPVGIAAGDRVVWNHLEGVEFIDAEGRVQLLLDAAKVAAVLESHTNRAA